MVVLLGASVAVGLHLVTRYYQNQITEKEKKAAELRAKAEQAEHQRDLANKEAERLKIDLGKANKKLAKLESAANQIQIPPSPGPAPATKQIITDLQKNSFELVLKPSSMIKPAVFGVTESDAQKMWQNSMQALRVPPLELKIAAQQNYINGLVDAKKLAEDYAASRTKEANAATEAANTYKQEADTLKIVVSDSKKALAAERKKKIVYGLGGLAAGYFIKRELTASR